MDVDCARSSSFLQAVGWKSGHEISRALTFDRKIQRLLATFHDSSVEKGNNAASALEEKT